MFGVDALPATRQVAGGGWAPERGFGQGFIDQRIPRGLQAGGAFVGTGPELLQHRARIEPLTARLKLSNAQAERLTRLLRTELPELAAPPAQQRLAIYRLGAAAVGDLVRLVLGGLAPLC